MKQTASGETPTQRTPPGAAQQQFKPAKGMLHTMSVSLQQAELARTRHYKSKRKRQARKGERFILFPEFVLLHSDWRQAPSGALPVLIDLCKRWKGQNEWNNNGNIGYGRRAAAAIGISKDKAGSLLDWLTEHDCISPPDDYRTPFLADGRRRAWEWRITFFPSFEKSATRKESASGIKAEGRRIKLLFSMLDSPAYIDAPNAAKTVLIELERLYNGSNNGNIKFAGEDGARIGLQPRTTERALAELQQRGFLVAMGPANGKRRRCRWRLTAHPASGKPATKEFMSWSEKSLACPDFDAGNSSTVPILTHSRTPVELAKPRSALEINRNAGETAIQPVPILTPANVKRGTHIDTRYIGEPFGSSGLLFPAGVEQEGASAGDLFGGDLPLAVTPQDQLRAELQQVFRRRRGTQSSVAVALGISRSKLSNALAGRKYFTTTTAGMLRQWLDGDRMPANWPALPVEVDADVA
jgi:hypothetical protein